MKKTFTLPILFITALLSAFTLNAEGDFSVEIVNNTGSPDTKIYIVAKGLNPITKKPTFIQFKTGTSVGEYADVTNAEGTLPSLLDPTKPSQLNPAKIKKSLDCSYEYTYFEASKGKYVMHLPHLTSGRIYISFDQKLPMEVNINDAKELGIADPDPFNTSSPSYKLLYDKVEFTYEPNKTVINPTAVDCFALPISISQKKLVDGKEISVTYGITQSREKTFSTIETMFKAPGVSPEWERLIIRNTDADKTILRIVAPGRNDAFFDPTYLNDFISAIWEYYKTNDLTIDCGELNNPKGLPGLGSYIFNGRVNGDELVFTNANNSSTVKIKKPESRNFFLAAQGAFDAPNKTIQAVLVRNICAAWAVGLLPAPEVRLVNGTTTNILKRDYFLRQKDLLNLYKDNPIIKATGSKIPWYNLYAKAIHSISNSIYAWPYDDAYDLDGTNTSTAKYPATLTIGRLTEKPKGPAAQALQVVNPVDTSKPNPIAPPTVINPVATPK